MAPKYKVGDRVRIRSLDWYNQNKDEDGDVPCAFFDAERTKYCSQVVTIDSNGYLLGSGTIIYAIKEDYEWIGEKAIEGLVGEEKIARAVMDKQVERDQLYQECLDAVPEDIKERVNLEVEFSNLVSLVKKMRDAQKRIDILAGGEDIEFVDMLFIEQREAEREVDEYLKKME